MNGNGRSGKAGGPFPIARIYGMAPKKIVNIIYFDPAWAVKITLVGPVVSGSMGDTDVYGGPQHAPLLGHRIPVPEDR